MIRQIVCVAIVGGVMSCGLACDKGKTDTSMNSSGASATNANNPSKPTTMVTGGDHSQPTAMTQMAGKTAAAMIAPSKGAATQPANQNVTGTAIFTATKDGVHVMIHLTGLSAGKHGIHIHEKSDLSDPSLMSVGGHWDPDMIKHHGGSVGSMRHAGDLGNIEADDSGIAGLDATIPDWTIGDGGKHDIVGHTVVVHAKEDDLMSNPSGNSGGRIAAGVIVVK